MYARSPRAGRLGGAAAMKILQLVARDPAQPPTKRIASALAPEVRKAQRGTVEHFLKHIVSVSAAHVPAGAPVIDQRCVELDELAPCIAVSGPGALKQRE
jgi:hypothetical protein